MFKSVVWSSTIDYPEQVSTVLFVGTCNWDCVYCYNKNLINKESIDFNFVIMPKLKRRQKFINHVVISGGECTCYKELTNVISSLKSQGFYVGIHTNGSNPKVLQNIIHQVDFIGMDIKTGIWESYNKITNSETNIFSIVESIETIIDSGKQYEFRTTVYPQYVALEECLEIAKLLQKLKSDKYVLQQFEDIFVNTGVVPYSIDYLQEIQQKCNEIIPTFIKGW